MKDSWRKLPDAPLGARFAHGAVWTGTDMLIWGGAFATAYTADGASYSPASDLWSSLPTSPLTPRAFFTAVWSTSTSEMIVWGGKLFGGPPTDAADGAAYKPATSTWRMLAASPLSARRSHSAVWAGNRMIVYGGGGGTCGASGCADGASYDPVTNAWTPLPAVPSTYSGRIYVGAAVVGAGAGKAAFLEGTRPDMSSEDGSGAVFDPAAFAWTAIVAPPSTVLSPAGRYFAATWSNGSSLWTWGGATLSADLSDGARFDLAAGTWTAMPTGGPSARENTMTVWDGNEAVIWGGSAGSSYFSDGKIYKP